MPTRPRKRGALRIENKDEVQRRVTWNLARTHIDPDLARDDVTALFTEAATRELEELRSGLTRLLPNELGRAEEVIRNAYVHAISDIWDAIAAAHSSIEVIEPILRSMSWTGQPLNQSLIEAVGRVFEESTEPLKAAFLARSLNAVARLTSQLDDADLGRAAGATSDYAVLVDALEKPEAIAIARDDDPLAGARLRGLRMRDHILQARGGTLTVEQVAQHLGLTRQGVDKRRRTGRLLALSTGRRGYAYPSWQFQADGVIPGFERVLKELSVSDPWMQAAFFLSSDSSLGGRTPLDALEMGDLENVSRAARAYGEQSHL